MSINTENKNMSVKITEKFTTRSHRGYCECYQDDGGEVSITYETVIRFIPIPRDLTPSLIREDGKILILPPSMVVKDKWEGWGGCRDCSITSEILGAWLVDATFQTRLQQYIDSRVDEKRPVVRRSRRSR